MQILPLHKDCQTSFPIITRLHHFRTGPSSIEPLLLSIQLTNIRHSKVSCGSRCENDLPLWLYLQFLHTSVPRPGATTAAATASTELRSLKFSNSNGATDGASNTG
jgi:hypothetical protein